MSVSCRSRVASCLPIESHLPEVACASVLGPRRTHDERLPQLRVTGLTEVGLARTARPVGLDPGTGRRGDRGVEPPRSSPGSEPATASRCATAPAQSAPSRPAPPSSSTGIRGPSIVLAETPDAPGHRRVDGGIVLDVPGRVRRATSFVRDLLAATASRSPQLSCFGMHEWAMVYRSDHLRHAAWPLRLGSSYTDAVLESLPVRCTHHDAFRFFTAGARSRNVLPPTRADQVALEQPGCLHATMDRYKWAYKSTPPPPRSWWRAAWSLRWMSASWTCGRAPTTSPRGRAGLRTGADRDPGRASRVRHRTGSFRRANRPATAATDRPVRHAARRLIGLY